MMFTRIVLVCVVLLFWSMAARAQTPTVDCVPIQGQGWQGCAPAGNNQQPQQPMQRPPIWADRWGALASDDAAGILGTALNMPDKNIAENVAMTNCQTKGGKHCVVVANYHNQCTAMVVNSQGGYDITVAPTADAATQLGMQNCKKKSSKCGVYYSACSYPIRVQ